MASGYPLPPPPTYPAMGTGGPGMKRGTKVLLWSLGGCSIVAVLLVIAAVVVGGVAFSRAFNLHVGHTVAPGDFPVYPGAKVSPGIQMGARNGGARESVTLVQWQAPDGGDRVAAWYGQHLNQGDWAVIEQSGSRFQLRRRSTGARALLQVQGQLSSSIVQLEMTGDQPLAAGATPLNSDSPPS